MACQSLNSIMKTGCEGNNIGGIYEVYINDQNEISGITIDNATHTITGITLSGLVKYSTYQFGRNVGSTVIEPAVDLINGSTVFNATITLQFNRREGSKSRSLMLLSEGQRFLSIIVKNAAGNYSYYDYAQLSGGAEDSGTVKEDGSKYTVTFAASMDQRPYFVDPTLIDDTIISTTP